MAGEIDVYTAPELREQLRELVSDGSYHIVVDLEKVDFLDSTGLGVLGTAPDGEDLGQPGDPEDLEDLLLGADQLQLWREGAAGWVSTRKSTTTDWSSVARLPLCSIATSPPPRTRGTWDASTPDLVGAGAGHERGGADRV